MSMSPYLDRCPEADAGEMLVLRMSEPGRSLPRGEYEFSEWYCADPGCDCRRTTLVVRSPQHPGRTLATLNYGWESEEFYTAWMHGDAEAGQEITRASLDPINPQSEFAHALRNEFRKYVRQHPLYPQQLQRHYEQFKRTLSAPAGPSKGRPPVPPMNTEEIIRQLRHLPGRCDFAPYEAALLAAIEQREAITPELIAAIDRVTADPAPFLRKECNDYLHSFAIYLLAQFREPRALEPFLRLFSLPDEQALDLTGDIVTEHGAAVLASVCGGNPAPLLQLALDETVNEFVRGQAIDGLLVQAGWGERPRAAVIDDLRHLFATLAQPGDPYVWAALIGVVCDFDAPELIPEARRAFAADLVDESIIGLDDVDPEAQRGPQRFPRPSGKELSRLFMERYAPINAVDECSAWICFRDEDQNKDAWADLLAADDDPLDDAIDVAPAESFQPPPLPVPYVAPPKVGRNDPCPCGSGKKHKKCCGNK